MISFRNIEKATKNLKYGKELTWKGSKNTLTLFIKNDSFKVTITSFPDTCGIHILSKLSTTITNTPQLNKLLKLIEEYSRLSRKSAQIYLIADQPSIRKILLNNNWLKITGSFINRNSANRNIIYIKHLYE